MNSKDQKKAKELEDQQNGQSLITNVVLEYFKKEWIWLVLLVVSSLIVNILQANGVSMITATIIDSIEKHKKKVTMESFYLLIVVLFSILVVTYGFKQLQYQILNELRQYIRYRTLSILLKMNNENMNQTNFAKIAPPINRVSTVCGMFFSDLFGTVLPCICFLIILMGYMTIYLPQIALMLLISTILLTSILYFSWDYLISLHDLYEEQSVNNELYMLEILSNMDKVIYRGQTRREIKSFEDLANSASEKLKAFLVQQELTSLAMNSIVASTVLMSIYFIVQLYYQSKLSSVIFVTVLTMMMLYRERMNHCIQMIPDFVDFVSRAKLLFTHFKFKPTESQFQQEDPIPPKIDLAFKEIRFDHVTFQYDSSEENIIDDFSAVLPTDKHQIIGITGLSGRGKSTIMKLLLRLHPCKKGKVTIDGVDVQTLDPDYLRHQITYVSQTGKLFDRNIMENVLYGCNRQSTCKEHIDYLLTYPKIKELFNGIDFETKSAGGLGENLSGGQRQVVNILSGLVNPCKIVIIDEPTNALDAALKAEVISLIDKYRVHKNAIIIITHDADMNPIFDQMIKIE